MVYLPKDNGTFELAPEGNHLAICYMVVDVGTQPGYEGRLQRKVYIGWELCGEVMEDGRPFSVRKPYTLSASRRSNLRRDLEAWRGRSFDPSEFGDDGFNLKDLLGVAAMVNVTHVTRGEKTYANIASLAPVPRQMEIPNMVNSPVHVSLEPQEFDPEAFESLSDWFREKICDSPEWSRLNKSESGGSSFSVDNDDSIPF